ncbi:hypothetical protein FRB95_007356 [Tulasnella sp. JGI-2019a]|nr:hypothetical protein FRB95_007356 [Tulasnella sp. JGI-2019a]
MPTANLPRGHACIECHNRKSRCDGGKPICSSCRRSHRQCVYNEPVVKSGQQQLLERMRQLEEMLAEIQADPRTSISSAGSTTSPSPPSPRSLSSHGEGQRSSSGSSQSRSRSPRADGELVPGTNMTWNRPGVVPTPPPTEMTRHLRQNLINYFFLHREKCFFEVHVPRFTAALSLSSGNPNALHPALVNAVLLIGCYWARAASLATLESQLLGQVLCELSMSYQQADRLHDHIRASNLVTFYYICKGMHNEAEVQIEHSARVAFLCGMHQIISSIHRPPIPGQHVGLLPPASDNIELGERIHTLWQIFSLDKIVSLITERPACMLGAPGVDSLLAVTTPWPRLMIEYETMNLSEMERQSVHDLYNLTPVFGLRPETLVGLEAQGLSVAQRAMYISTFNYAPGAPELDMLDKAIQKYIDRLPGLRNEGGSGQILATQGHSSINHRLVFIRTLGFTASLLLHQHLKDRYSHDRCNIAAQNLAAIVSELTPDDYGRLSIGLGHLWVTTGCILVSLTEKVSSSGAQHFRGIASTVLSGLKQLSIVYPPLGFQTRHLHQIIYGTP